MKLRISNPALLSIALLGLTGVVSAQDTTGGKPEPVATVCSDNSNTLNKHLKSLNLTLNAGLKHLELAVNDGINTGLKELQNIDFRFNNDQLEEKVANGSVSQRVKTYSKSYSMDPNDKLSIDNKFGKVIVNTWNKNEVKVDVEIKSFADNDQTAQKMIDAISISDSKNGDEISFHTNFGSGSSNSVWDLFNNRNDNHKAEVNYTIYMPSKNSLSIDNRYGATQLPDFNGKVDLECAYGSLTTKSLMHDGNQIKVRYGSANIEDLSSSDVSVSYGSLQLGTVDKLNCEVRYSSAKIGKIKTTGNINAHYAGSIQIDALDKNFSSFSYSSSYSGIKIGMDNAANANFDVTVKYGSFNYGDVPVEITQKTPSDESKGWKPTKNYKGHVGKGSNDKMINISSSYGDVKFE